MTARPVTLTLEARTVDLAAEVLRAGAGHRRKAAERGAVELEAGVADGTVKDRRSPSVAIVRLLGEAGVLDDLAAELEAGYAGPGALAATHPDLLTGIDDDEPPAPAAGPILDGTDVAAHTGGGLTVVRPSDDDDDVADVLALVAADLAGNDPAPPTA